MFIAKYEAGNEAELAARAADVIRNGGVVLFPTDTLYCLGADALSDAAVDAVYAIKGRDDKKPMHALVRDEAMASEYGAVDDAARALLAQAPQGKLSLVVPQQSRPKTGILRGIDTFGFRIPDHPLCQEILAAFGGPITATSANAAGAAPARTLGAILAQLGPAVLLVDLAIDGGELPESEPSTVVSLAGEAPVLLRQGAAQVVLG